MRLDLVLPYAVGVALKRKKEKKKKESSLLFQMKFLIFSIVQSITCVRDRDRDRDDKSVEDEAVVKVIEGWRD